MKQYGMPVFGTVQEANPAAQTTHGAVRGENRQGIAIFRGIPYGGACEGAGRFLPPVPAEDWSGVRDGTARYRMAAVSPAARALALISAAVGLSFLGWQRRSRVKIVWC